MSICKNSVRTLVLATSSLVLLTACDPNMPMGWFPVGYTYEDDSPITSPAPSKPWMNEAVITSTEGLAASTAAWQGAVYELLDKAAPALGSTPIMLQARPPYTNQKQAFDHYLRQGLLQRGQVLQTMPTGAQVLTYDVLNLSNKETRDWAVAKLGAQAVPGADVPGADMKDVYLLRLTGATGLDEAVVAVFAGEKTEYQRWSGYSNQPDQGFDQTPVPVYTARD